MRWWRLGGNSERGLHVAVRDGHILLCGGKKKTYVFMEVGGTFGGGEDNVSMRWWGRYMQ